MLRAGIDSFYIKNSPEVRELDLVECVRVLRIARAVKHDKAIFV